MKLAQFYLLSAEALQIAVNFNFSSHSSENRVIYVSLSLFFLSIELIFPNI